MIRGERHDGNVVIQPHAVYCGIASPATILRAAALTELSVQQLWHVVSTALSEQLAAHSLTPPATPSGRHVNYLSMEFLPGRLTGNNLINLGWYTDVAQALARRAVPPSAAASFCLD
ncbi:MAG: hypothetical protein ACMZI0_03260 [Symbiopectobacterium sp.]|uniref:hypothetical protein n=1 Tax=Symbiopectobacterium sp. TaxID=2952789 RepID=UPI0039EC1E2E